MKDFFDSLYWAGMIVVVMVLLAVAYTSRGQPILVGFDAQPTTNFDGYVGMGNALHRYDDRGGRDTMETWVTEAEKRSLSVIVQGTKVKDWPALLKHKNIVAIAQDDEPDMNRRASNGSNDSWTFTPADAPHPGAVGWTRYTVLQAQFGSWRQLTDLPIAVNFTANSISNVYYKPDMWLHKPYFGAANQTGLDCYPKNNRGDGGDLYEPVYAFEKLRSAGGNPVDLYIECSDQALDGDEAGGVGRGPTPAEQGTLFWSALGHRAKRLWYFPQRIGSPAHPAFLYNNMRPENAQRARDDFAILTKYMDLIGTTPTITAATPPFSWDPNRGNLVYPKTETYTWRQGERSLTVTVDFTGKAPPVIVASRTLAEVEAENTTLKQSVEAYKAWLNAAPK